MSVTSDRSIYIVQQPHVMFYTASLRAKNMRNVEHACVISASATCTERFAESADAGREQRERQENEG